MAASFNCWVVTLLVCSKRKTSLAASWTVGSKVVTQCWMSELFQLSVKSSFSAGCGGCRTSARTGGLCAGGVGGWDGAAEPVAWLVLFTGVRGSPKLWSFCFARASSSVVFLRARRAVPSAGAGEWD